MDENAIRKLVLDNMTDVIKERTEERFKERIADLLNADGTMEPGNLIYAAMRVSEMEVCEVLIRTMAKLL